MINLLYSSSSPYATGNKHPAHVLDVGFYACGGYQFLQTQYRVGNKNQCQNGRYRQTANYGNRHRTPHLRTLTCPYSHRHHTENSSQQ